jgi:hypothetical protein
MVQCEEKGENEHRRDQVGEEKSIRDGKESEGTRLEKKGE